MHSLRVWVFCSSYFFVSLCVTPAHGCFCILSAFLSRDVRSPPGRGWAKRAIFNIWSMRVTMTNFFAADVTVKSIGVYFQHVSLRSCCHWLFVSSVTSLKMGCGGWNLHPLWLHVGTGFTWSLSGLCASGKHSSSDLHISNKLLPPCNDN